MQLRSWIAWVAGVTVLAWSTVAMVQAQTVTVSDITDAVPSSFSDAATSAPDPAGSTPLSPISAAQDPPVTFSDITDAVPSRFFDAATTAPDPDNGNKLLIGFNTGFDAETWTVNEFTASTAAFHHAAAMDTISFLIEAPNDFYIAKITYTQRGAHGISRIGRAAGGVHWVVDGVPADLGLFHTDPTLSGTVDLTGQNKIFVPVSITCGLFAFTPPLVASATISITSAEVLVELLPLRQ
jgi:hypothetical protein